MENNGTDAREAAKAPMLVCHGSNVVVEIPRIIRTKYTKDFGYGLEWLDFVVACRHGEAHPHDIVEGPMANDTIYNYVQDFIDGRISRSAFWELAKFKYPTHQVSFHTARALDTLQFVKAHPAGNTGM